MNVPRGTPVTAADSWRPKCVALETFWADALRRGLKTQMRVLLGAHNSTVHPGSFEGLDLETGRARLTQPGQLRARCRFASGNVRAVSVLPMYCRGDLLWVRSRGSRRSSSRLTLEVTRVDLARVQDMTNADALAEGVEMLPAELRRELEPRHWYAAWWERCHQLRAWRRNEWVWVLRFRVHPENVDALLERWRSA